jgi:hypothetical protein
MAVEDKLVTHNATSQVVDVGDSILFGGGRVVSIPFSFEVAAADDNNSVYRFARISPQAIIKSLKLLSDATAGMTDTDFGFYKPLELGGAVIDKDCIVDGADINAGKAVFTEMFVPTIADVGKRAYEIAGVTDYQKYGAFDVAMTSVAAASAAGTISGVLEIILPL